MKTIYITKDQAIDTHRKTILYSGGGDFNIINEGYLCSALELIQNNDYYPTFEDKLVHLVWSINRNHSFSDGNKRLSITLGVQFLSMNGYLFCISRFLHEMENVSYHLAAGLIDKDLLRDIIHSIIEGELDFDIELKARILCAIDSNMCGFDEQNEEGEKL
jgi:death-on-curing protein